MALALAVLAALTLWTGSSADDRGIWLRDAKRALSFAVSSFPSMER
jgi:hypothetical protein